MRRVLSAAGVAALVLVGGLLAGCGEASEQDQLVDTLRSDFGMGQEQAECVADQLYERFSAEEIETLREAESRDDLPEDLLGQLRGALTPCAGS